MMDTSGIGMGCRDLELMDGIRRQMVDLVFDLNRKISIVKFSSSLILNTSPAGKISRNPSELVIVAAGQHFGLQI